MPSHPDKNYLSGLYACAMIDTQTQQLGYHAMKITTQVEDITIELNGLKVTKTQRVHGAFYEFDWTTPYNAMNDYLNQVANEMALHADAGVDFSGARFVITIPQL